MTSKAFNRTTTTTRPTRSRLFFFYALLYEVHYKNEYESFYDSSSPQLFYNEIVGFETSSRPYLLNEVR